MGASNSDLLYVFTKQIRSVAEFAVPVWNSSLTGEDIADIERLQKTALHIILGDDYKSYNSALNTLGLKKLSERRRRICLTFDKKAEKNTNFSAWFKPNIRKTIRCKQSKYSDVFCKKIRFNKSPISYMTKLLNQ